MTDLQAWYHKFNDSYFRNQLPPIRILRRKLAPLKGGYRRYGYTHFIGDDPVVIVINSELWLEIALLTLLHEMCHVRLPRRVNHGKRFQAEMLRLAKKGAFTNLW